MKPESLVLSEIKKECHFADKEPTQMTNKEKRNLLYWWYATNVYLILGKATRAELPPCLEHAVRVCYPNDKGDPYKGFKRD